MTITILWNNSLASDGSRCYWLRAPGSSSILVEYRPLYELCLTDTYEVEKLSSLTSASY